MSTLGAHLGDLYALDLPTRQWRQLSDLNVVPNLARAAHTAVAFGTRMIIWGGSVRRL